MKAEVKKYSKWQDLTFGLKRGWPVGFVDVGEFEFEVVHREGRSRLYGSDVTSVKLTSP